MTGVYVHIPYCVRKCAYCDFCSMFNKEKNEHTHRLQAIKRLG